MRIAGLRHGIDRRFGTWRGLVRLVISYAEIALDPRLLPKIPATEIRRLVFVCHGNICRSAFAEAVARAQGLQTASLGLSTSSGKPAHPPAAAVARMLGYDLTAHRTTTIDDYKPVPGDLLFAMETRHLRRLAADPRVKHLPRTLLGLHLRPSMPHLHDPYKLDPDYMTTCLTRVAEAVRRLPPAFPAAKTGEQC